MRQYLKAVDGFLELDTPFIPSLQRRHDTFLMDAVLRSGQFTPGAVKRINYCRLYLRVITLQRQRHSHHKSCIYRRFFCHHQKQRLVSHSSGISGQSCMGTVAPGVSSLLQHSYRSRLERTLGRMDSRQEPPSSTMAIMACTWNRYRVQKAAGRNLFGPSAYEA